MLIPLGFRDGDEVVDLADHAANLGRIDQYAAAVHTAQAQTTHGGAMVFAGADDGTHERNLDLLLCHDLPQDFFHRLATLGGDFGGGGAGAQTVEGCADHVVGVAGAQALGNDVTHAHYFEDGAHRATGDHARTFCGGRDEHRGGAVLADDGVMQRAVLERHLEQTAASLFHGLLNGHRNFASLALAHADAAIAVTDHGQRRKAHGATTLDNLADAIDRDHLLAQAVVFLVGSVFALCFSHLTIPCLEFQTGFTRGLGQRLDTAVITEARTVEGDLLDAGCLGLFGHALADQPGSSNVAAGAFLVCQLFAHFGFQRGSADQHPVAFRRNDACVDMRVRPVHRQAMYAQFGDLPAGCDRTTQTGDFFVHDSSLPVRLLLLGFFENDAFIGVTHTLALVGLGLAICTDLRGSLANHLLVGALEDDFRLAGALGLNACGQLVHDVVRETELQLQRVALDLGTETHANQIQAAFETLTDARDHVIDQRTQGAGHGLSVARVVRDGEGKLIVFLANVHVAGEFLRESAQGALHDDLASADRGFDALGQLDGVLSNA